MAAIWEIYEKFLANICEAYLSSECLTADEMMIPFRGHCLFKVYMPKKPTKQGIKVFGLVGIISNYFFNFEIYAGQQPEGSFQISNLPTDVIIQMIDLIRNSGRTITLDNYATSLLLFQAIKEEHGLQAVVTVNKNRTFIPLLFLATKIVPNQDQPALLSIFGFNNVGKLVSYCSPTKCVTILFSTLHQHKNE